MSWFTDLFGRDQEQEIEAASAETYADALRADRLENAWSDVCGMCGGAGGVECPERCGGWCGGITNCTRCGGGGAVPCPACVCMSCGGEGVVDCPAGCAHNPEGGGVYVSCQMCEDQGVVECPLGCVE